MNILEKYQSTGTFTFKVGERLASKCVDIANETDVYLIYAVKKNKKELLYIAASGKMNQDGSFKVKN